PAFSCTSIVEERLNRSLDLLLVTRLRPWEVFAGKLFAAFVYCATFLAGTLPVVALSFLFGGVEPSAIVAVYACGLATALLICAGAALLFSAFLRRLAALPSPPTQDIFELALIAPCVAAVLLFIPVLVFSTERADLSRRVTADLAARFRLSPIRLLGPGPG